MNMLSSHGNQCCMIVKTCGSEAIHKMDVSGWWNVIDNDCTSSSLIIIAAITDTIHTCTHAHARVRAHTHTHTHITIHTY